MDKFLEQLNALSDNKYTELRTHSIKIGNRKKYREGLDKTPLEIILLVPYSAYDTMSSDANMTEIRALSARIIPPTFEPQIVLRKSHCTVDTVKDALVAFSSKNYSSIMNQLSDSTLSIKLEGGDVSISMTFQPFMKDYIFGCGYSEKLCDHLSHSFTETFYVKIEYTEADILNEALLAGDDIESEVITVSGGYDVVKKQLVHNMPISGKPRFIEDVKGAESHSEIIAGVISNFTKGVSKKGKVYYIFTLNDTTGSMQVKLFGRTDKPFKGLENLSDGVSVMCEGKIVSEENEFAGRKRIQYSMMLSACTEVECDFAAERSRTKVYKNIPRSYKRVRPVPFTNPRQQSFDFGEGDDNRKQIEDVPKYLRNKTIVVYDLETTGTNVNSDRIVEIGAYKMVNGVITEHFATLVNPEVHIPAGATAVNNITDDMVQDAPTIAEVIGDFMKFTEGAKLVAHNAAFDVQFMKRVAADCDYKLDNEYDCTMLLSMKYMRSANFKLVTLCKNLGIALIDAHRASGDAIATCELYYELAKLM